MRITAIVATLGVIAAVPALCLTTAAPAGAGCQATYFGWNNGRTICDDPKNPDGSWGRCLYAGGGDSGGGFTNCYVVLPDAIPLNQPDWIPGPNMAPLGPGPAPRYGGF
ncbi:hypothetical protein MU0083_001976 [[Mycobacterium] kokjensenii]|uniref:CDGP domain-containing protein n=1 Tax=[Mycobacterium] kokjensenii TaxID=3064287 RepID=A0ABM9LGJ5_9MYCO|nr:hypothetical protein [Mycolicibacter sp. MU0083]CAJ1498626.1 hypothetical protein MU0083_001976 [Mycolicibacter sp. MU0083]